MVVDNRPDTGPGARARKRRGRGQVTPPIDDNDETEPMDKLDAAANGRGEWTYGRPARLDGRIVGLWIAGPGGRCLSRMH